MNDDSRKSAGGEGGSSKRGKWGKPGPEEASEDNISISKLSVSDLLESIPAAVMVIDSSMKVVFANPRAVESLSFDPAGLDRKGIVERLPGTDGGSLNSFTGKLIPADLLERKPAPTLFCRFRNSAGEYRSILGAASVTGPGEAAEGAVAVWHDITDMLGRKAEALEGTAEAPATEREKEELDKLREELERTRRLRSIGSLAASVAHELRNPLGVIRTAAYNIQRKNSNPDLERHISNVQKKINQSVLIINNLLNYSSIKMPDFKEVVLADILNESIRSIEELFPKKEIGMVKNFDDLRGRVISVDPDQMRQVFTNLLKNSFQAVNDGGIVEVKAGTADGVLEIEICDNGCGICEEKLEKVFDPFHSGKATGTGLGLAICRELVELHGGDIYIRSNRGEFTAVTVRIPLGEER
jgi:signal transduction histidine kinase